MTNKQNLRKVRALVGFFIAGLVLSGATAIPVLAELRAILTLVGNESQGTIAPWLHQVYIALEATDAQYPFLAYGYDWLAFGHFVIALAFVGAWRDPVKNIWLFEFGMLACVAVIPYALIFGAFRGIPFLWRLIDCSFGVLGFWPLWYARRLTLKVDATS